MQKSLISIVFLASILISCESDDNEGNSGEPKITNPIVTGEFGTTEESKVALENNAIEVLEKIEEFNNDTALEKIIELAEFLNGNSETEETTIQPKILNSTLTNISLIKSQELDLAEFNTAQANVVTNTLEDDFNDEACIYTWSDEENDFIKTGDSDDLIYNISYNGKNAVFSITEFITDDYLGGEELPTSVKSNLTIDGVTVFAQTHTASIDSNKYLPNNYTSSISIGELNLESTLSNNSNSSITESISFEIDGDTVMYLGATSDGNLSEIDNNGENTESNFEDVITTSEFTMTFLNASVTFDGEIPADFNSETEYTDNDQLYLLNDNIDIVLSVDSKLVANGEFYLETVINEFISYDGTEYITTTQENKNLNIRFKFPDDTTSDFDTYFNDNFTTVEDKLESVFDLFSDKASQAGI